MTFPTSGEKYPAVYTAVSGERFERPAQDVIVKVLGYHAGAEGTVDSDRREKLRIQVEASFHESETEHFRWASYWMRKHSCI